MEAIEEESSLQDAPGEICRLTKSCRMYFERCLSIPLFAGLDWLDDRRGEFNLWIGSLNAANVGRSSLDFRVRYHPEVCEKICDLLGGLEEVLASLLIKGM